MELINAHFDAIVFIKVEQKESYTIYAAMLSSAYRDGRKQYAIAIVPTHLALLDKAYLKELPWVSFQTRSIINGYRIQPQRWEIKKGVANTMFSLVERDNLKTKYKADNYPLEMILMHDPKKKTVYQYHNQINLLASLITFRCILSHILPSGGSVPPRGAPTASGITTTPRKTTPTLDSTSSCPGCAEGYELVPN